MPPHSQGPTSRAPPRRQAPPKEGPGARKSRGIPPQPARPPGDNRWNHPPNPKGHHSNKSPKSCPSNRPELAFLLFPESGLMLVSLLLSSNGGCSSAGRAPGCDPGCRGFESRQPPPRKPPGLRNKVRGFVIARHLAYARPPHGETRCGNNHNIYPPATCEIALMMF